MSIQENFNILKDMGQFNLTPPRERFRTNISDPMEKLAKCLKDMVTNSGSEYKHNEAYEDVAKWLGDNKGKGLLLMGQCGLGKSMLVKYVIPFIIGREYGKCFKIVDATELRTKEQVDDAMQYRFIVLDDVGSEEIIRDYGNIVDGVSSIISSAERDGKFLLISTNLAAKQLRERYGDRVIDRLRGACKQIAITGESNR